MFLGVALLAAALPAAKPGQCGWVHGRFAIYNGSGVQRIWIIGTRRVVALFDDDNALPPAIERYERNGPSREALFGDFRICAQETRRPGHMQHVRVTATRNLRLGGKPF